MRVCCEWCRVPASAARPIAGLRSALLPFFPRGNALATWFRCRSYGIVRPPRRGRHDMGKKPNGGDRPPTSGCRILILGGSKGGCGRSTLAKNLLVLAGQAGIRAVGID